MLADEEGLGGEGMVPRVLGFSMHPAFSKKHSTALSHGRFQLEACGARGLICDVTVPALCGSPTNASPQAEAGVCDMTAHISHSLASSDLSPAGNVMATTLSLTCTGSYVTHSRRRSMVTALGGSACEHSHGKWFPVA